LKILYEKGLAIKSKNFISWEDVAIKAYHGDIAKIEMLQKNLVE
jgi:hypothetical protein